MVHTVNSLTMINIILDYIITNNGTFSIKLSLDHKNG